MSGRRVESDLSPLLVSNIQRSLNLEFQPPTSITLDTSSTLLLPLQHSTVSLPALPFNPRPLISKVEKKGRSTHLDLQLDSPEPEASPRVITDHLESTHSPSLLIPTFSLAFNHASYVLVRLIPSHLLLPYLLLTSLSNPQAQPRRYPNLFIEKSDFFRSTNEIRSSW